MPNVITTLVSGGGDDNEYLYCSNHCEIAHFTKILDVNDAMALLHDRFRLCSWMLFCISAQMTEKLKAEKEKQDEEDRRDASGPTSKTDLLSAVLGLLQSGENPTQVAQSLC